MNDGTQTDMWGNQIGFKAGTRMYRFLRESKHMFRGDDGTPRAWTIGAVYLEKWAAAGIEDIVILDRSTDQAWWATVDTWLNESRYDAKDAVNGYQYYLEPDHFEITKGWKAAHDNTKPGNS